MMVSAIHQHESTTGIHESPYHEPFPTSLHTLAFWVGPERALTLDVLLHASNLHWSSVLHMVIYMFQCYSLKSFHPFLLPESPKVCFLHLVSFAVLHVGLSLLCFQIPCVCVCVCICINIQYLCFSLIQLDSYNRLHSHPSH